MSPEVATSGGSYRLPLATRRRWTEERLRLTEDGAERLLASFDYDCTTCNNGGLPFPATFIVELIREHDRFRILTMRCRAADDDDRYLRMCTVDPDLFAPTDPLAMGLESDDLSAVLRWQPATNEGGCLCSRLNRNHKWRNVLETVCFALAADGRR